MEIAKVFYDAVSNIKYRSISIYNYLQTSIDTLVFLRDCPEKIDERGLFKGVYQGMPIYEDTENKSHDKVKEFLDSLGKRDTLFFTSTQFRKEANGRLYHTVLDPYILSLSEGQYAVIECGDGRSPMFYEDVHVWDYDAVRCTYGVDSIDFEDLFSFLEREFFSLVCDILGLTLSDQVKHGITTFLFYRLCFRKSEYSFALDILGRVNPKVIMYSHGCNPCFMYLAEAAYALGIPAVEIAHGAYVPLPEKPTGINDFYMLQSPINTACSVSLGYNSLFCIGKPGFGITKARRLMAKDGPIIVMFVSSCEYGLLDFAVDLSNTLDPRKYTVVFRLHSGERYTVEYLQGIQENNKNLILTVSSEPIEVALDESDIIVGNRTTVLLEALRYKNLKVITCNLPEAPMPPKDKEAYIWEKMICSGEMVRVSSLDELVDEINSYRRDEFSRDKEIYWRYDGDTVFPAFIDLFANKNEKMTIPAGETFDSVMALYDADAASGINDMVSSETDVPMEYVGIESSDDEEELIDYIKNSPCEYIIVIRSDASQKDDKKKRNNIMEMLSLMSNNPYLDAALAVAGDCEDVMKCLSTQNATRYHNIVRTGIYPLNNLLDLCSEEPVVANDLSVCIYRKNAFVRICSYIDIHNFLKQSSMGLAAMLEKCRELSLKISYAEKVYD